MFFVPKRIVGIDVSDTSLEAVLVDVGATHARVKAWARADMPAGLVERGVIHDVQELGNVIARTLRSAKPHPITARHAVFVLPERYAFSRMITVPTGTAKERITALIRQDVAGFVPYPTQELVIEQVGISKGANAVSICYVAVPKVVLENMAYTAVAAKLRLVGIDPEALALGRVAIRACPPHTSCGVLDIGQRVSTFAIFSQDGLRRTAAMTFGGDTLSAGLIARNHLSPTEAEQEKRSAGFGGRADSTVRAALEKETGPLVAELKRSLEEYKTHFSEQPGQIFLAGGTALVPGLDAFLSDQCELPVRLLDISRAGVQFSDRRMTDPQVLFAGACGAAMSVAASTFPRMHVAGLERMRAPREPVKMPERADGKRARFSSRAFIAANKRAVVLGGALFCAVALLAGVFVWRQQRVTAPVSAVVGEEFAFPVRVALDGSAQTGELLGSTVVQEVTGTAVVSLDQRVEVAGVASGTIRMVNRSAEPVAFEQGTRVMSPTGAFFRLMDDVTVPARGESPALVIADAAGAQEASLEGKWTIPSLPAEQQIQIFGQLDTLLRGGVVVRGEIRDQAVELAVATLRATLTGQAQAAFQSTLAAGQVLAADVVSSELVHSQIPEQGTWTNGRDPEVRLVLRVTGVTMPRESLREYTRLEWSKRSTAAAPEWQEWEVRMVHVEDGGRVMVGEVRARL